MHAKPQNPRTPDWDIDSMFTDRWSPRAFLPDPLPEHQVQTLFEAARWAPSCYNEQPWLFIYATEPEARKRLAACLVAKNQLWASHAPLLMFILARRNFQKTGKENRHAPYDAGAAWMALALQARKLGLYAHAMAGFNLEKAYEVLGRLQGRAPGDGRHCRGPQDRGHRPARGPARHGKPEQPQAPRGGCDQRFSVVTPRLTYTDLRGGSEHDCPLRS